MLLQNLLGHPEALPAPFMDPQLSHLHLNKYKKEGVSIPHCSVGCFTLKGLIGIKFQVNTKLDLGTTCVKPRNFSCGNYLLDL